MRTVEVISFSISKASPGKLSEVFGKFVSFSNGSVQSRMRLHRSSVRCAIARSFRG